MIKKRRRNDEKDTWNIVKCLVIRLLNSPRRNQQKFHDFFFLDVPDQWTCIKLTFCSHWRACMKMKVLLIFHVSSNCRKVVHVWCDLFSNVTA